MYEFNHPLDWLNEEMNFLRDYVVQVAWTYRMSQEVPTDAIIELYHAHDRRMDMGIYRNVWRP